MANSSFETFKQGGEAIDKAAEKTGQQAGTMYEQAKTTASDAYDSAAGYAGDAVARVQDGAVWLDARTVGDDEVGPLARAVASALRGE